LLRLRLSAPDPLQTSETFLLLTNLDVDAS
jgi:hypothetical protein